MLSLAPLLWRCSLAYTLDFTFPNLVVTVPFSRARILFRSLILSPRTLLSDCFPVMMLTAPLFRHTSGRGSRGRLVGWPGYFSPVCFCLRPLSGSSNIFSFSTPITSSTSQLHSVNMGNYDYLLSGKSGASPRKPGRLSVPVTPDKGSNRRASAQVSPGASLRQPAQEETPSKKRKVADPVFIPESEDSEDGIVCSSLSLLSTGSAANMCVALQLPYARPYPPLRSLFRRSSVRYGPAALHFRRR